MILTNRCKKIFSTLASKQTGISYFRKTRPLFSKNNRFLSTLANKQIKIFDIYKNSSTILKNNTKLSSSLITNKTVKRYFQTDNKIKDVSKSDSIIDNKIKDVSKSDSIIDNKIKDVSKSDSIIDNKIKDVSRFDEIKNMIPKNLVNSKYFEAFAFFISFSIGLFILLWIRTLCPVSGIIYIIILLWIMTLCHDRDVISIIIESFVTLYIVVLFLLLD